MKPLNLLVIEDNPGDFLLLQSYLYQTGLEIKNLFHIQTISELSSPPGESLDLLFLDLTLPDSKGTDSFKQVNALFSHVPVIVLSGLADERTAVECIALGAQDYLLKNDLNEKFLAKSIQYSIERKKNMERIRQSVEQYELIGKISNDIIWRWDLKSNQIESAAKEFFDYCCEDIDFDLNWWMEKIHPKDRPRLLSVVGKFATGILQNAQEEYRFKCANGSYKQVFNRAFLLKNESGQPLAVIGSMMDVTERYELQQQLYKQTMDHQKRLTSATIEGQEKEREQIGKELHDNINQVLASVKLFLEMGLSCEDMRMELLLRSKQNVEYAIDEIRKLSHALIPPAIDDRGLLDALEELTSEINMAASFRVHLNTGTFEETRLDSSMKLTIYRIVQEQMNNILKYAKASVVTLELGIECSQITLKLSDDGVGFDTSARSKGVGLKNIESRVANYSGTVTLTSSPGKGTIMQVIMPLD